MLRAGHLAGLEGVLQLLQRRPHSRVGPAQPDVGQAVPGPHGRRVVHRHLGRRLEAVDRRAGQHGALVGPARGPPAAAARLHLADLLAGLLPDGRVARRRHGELQRRGAARDQARQVPAAPARVVRALAQVRLLRQVVRVHRQGQSPQRLAHPLRGFHIPGKMPAELLLLLLLLL